MTAALSATGRRPVLLGGATLILLSVLCGRAVVETQAIESGTASLLLLTAAVLAAVAIMFAGPVTSLAVLVGLSIVPLLPSFSLGGGSDVRPADAFYVPLLIWGIIVIMRGGQWGRSGLRGAPMLVFLGFTGLTLLFISVVDPDALGKSFVSWLRFVQTMSIAYLVALLLNSTRDVKVLLAVIAVAGAVAVLVAVVSGVGDAEPGLGARGGGEVNPNSLGLVSGLLVLMGVLAPLGRQLLYRIPLVLLGSLGLVQSQSVGATVGTSVALTLALALMYMQQGRVPGLRVVWALCALAIALAGAYGIASALRPENLPHSKGFEESTTWHRTVVGAAGVELAVQNPVIGVGWRRSSEPDVIGDPDLTRNVRRRLKAKEAFYPDVEPASVHNAYVQIAAELGLIGLGLFAVVLFTLGKDIRRMFRHIPRGSIAWRQLWYLGWAVVLTMVWFNDTPLFGGQPETVVLAALVGAIGALGKAVPDRLAGQSSVRAGPGFTRPATPPGG